MKVASMKVNYPNGNTMLDLGEIEGRPDEIIQIMAAGLNDLLTKMPEITKIAAQAYDEWQRVKSGTKQP